MFVIELNNKPTKIMETSKPIKEKYFHGIGSLVSKATGYSKKYVRDVLNGDYDDRDTEAVKQIKACAELYMAPVNNPEVLQSA